MDPNTTKNAKSIEPYQVYEKFKLRKFKKCSVTGDIPSELKREFLVELAAPAADIFNSITMSGEYPRQWVKEYTTPVPKTKPVESEDDLRPISLTSDLSKDYENFLIEWLEPYVSTKLDPGQMGGRKGCSIVHYLITLFHFILSGTDTTDKAPKAVIIALIDYSKGFNRISHNKLIIRLSDWGVPGWLLRILCSYLKDRSMTLRHKGTESSPHPLPGGSAQGCVLGILSFIVDISDSGMDVPSQPPPNPDEVDVHSLPQPQPAVTASEVRQKFIDDQVQGELLKLDTDLHKMPENFIGPRTYHDRHGLVNKEETLLQKRLNDIELHTSIHQMKINTKKTKIMPFNFTKKFDFNPKFTIDGRVLDVVHSTKLLGIVIQSDCKWGGNTKNIVSKAKKRIWFLRRLKLLGASRGTLIDTFKLFIRSLLEMGVPIWAAALTKKQSQDIEAVQINCLKVICGLNFITYQQSLAMLNLETLAARRDKLCLKFAKKCAKDPKFSGWFPKKVAIGTRSKNKYLEPRARTKRFQTSSIPHLTRLLNSA